MNAWLTDFVRDYGPALLRWAGLIIVLLASPLLVLAWWKRIYPHTTLVVALAVPCVLSLALLVDSRLLPVIVAIDVLIPLVAIFDLFMLPGKKAFAIERETTRIVLVQQHHRVTIQIRTINTI